MTLAAGDLQAESGQVVAAFDFDGTLLPGDSLLPWLAMACGRSATASAVAASVAESLGGSLAGAVRRSLGGWRTASPGVSPPGALQDWPGIDRDLLKARVLRRLLAGRELAELATHAQAHAAALVTRLRPQTLAQLRRHQSARHRVVIVSASPELYLAPVGQALGLDAVIGTRLEVGADGRLTGRLDGPNCRGSEKVVRLRDWMDRTLQGAPSQVCAYGDSSGDDEMMAMADISTWVGRRNR